MIVRGKNCFAIAYQHDLSGWETSPLGEGDYDIGALQERGFVNDDMSSLKVFKDAPETGVPEYGSEGCWVATYEHHWDTGHGWEAIFDEGDYDCGTFDSRHD